MPTFFSFPRLRLSTSLTFSPTIYLQQPCVVCKRVIIKG